jgi:hypothetical protein
MATLFTYDYEAGTQLGYPVINERPELGSLLHWPLSAQNPEQDLPPGIPARPLHQGLMRAVHQWVLRHGSHLLFLYGQDDPWTSEKFSIGPRTRDSAIFTIPNGNHVSSYTDLPAAQRKELVAMLRGWAGLAGSASALPPFASWTPSDRFAGLR